MSSFLFNFNFQCRIGNHEERPSMVDEEANMCVHYVMCMWYRLSLGLYTVDVYGGLIAGTRRAYASWLSSTMSFAMRYCVVVTHALSCRLALPTASFSYDSMTPCVAFTALKSPKP